MLFNTIFSSSTLSFTPFTPNPIDSTQLTLLCPSKKFQFASTEDKLDLQEFIAFVKVEGNVQGLLLLLPSAIDS